MGENVIWVARDSNGPLCLYYGEPVKLKGYGKPYFIPGPTGEEIMNIDEALYPELQPGEKRRLILADE